MPCLYENTDAIALSDGFGNYQLSQVLSIAKRVSLVKINKQSLQL